MANKKSRPTEKAKIEVSGAVFESSFSAYNRGQKYLTINVSDLKLRLGDFKKSVKKSDLVNPLVGMAGVWLPLFTSEFRTSFGIDGGTIKGIYVCLAVILTVVLIRNILSTFMAYMVRNGFFSEEDFPSVGDDYDIKHENDPERLVELLCEEEE